jgi:hypothetical protein
MYAMTAAHPTLPIPSYARVTALDNGKSVVVRINDRGPFHGKRIIDLSYAAAHKTGLHPERQHPGASGKYRRPPPTLNEVTHPAARFICRSVRFRAPTMRGNCATVWHASLNSTLVASPWCARVRCIACSWVPTLAKSRRLRIVRGCGNVST